MTNENYIDINVLYRVFNDGRVYSFRRNQFMKLKEDKDGYLNVSLRIAGKRIDIGVHRLIGLLFIPNPKNYKDIHHKDKNKHNNDISNLEWVNNHNHKEIDCGISVDCFDLDGNFVKHYDSFRATEKDGHIANHVMYCAYHKPGFYTHHKLRWELSN
jgi:hypothetical protein